MDPNTQLPSNEPATSELISQRGSGRRKRRLIMLIVGIVVLLGAGGLIFGLTHHGDKTQTVHQKIVNKPRSVGPKNPANLNGVAVGNYPYVIACKAFTPVMEQDLFAGLSETSLTSATYAEDSIPAGDIPVTGIQSKCARQFGSDTNYAGTTVIFTVTQFATPELASKYYSTFTVTQSELDQGNKKFKTNLTTDFGPLAGVQNTVYGGKEHTSYTLLDNKVLSFSASLGNITDNDFHSALTKAIPAVVANTAAITPSLSRPNDTSVFGQKVGDAMVYNPCEFFTAADYKSGLGVDDNPTDVTITYNFNSAQNLNSDIHDGYLQDSCQRYSYPGTNIGHMSMNLTVHYYKTAAEAATYVKQNVQKMASDSFYKLSAQPVTGIGSYAAFLKPDAGSTIPISYFYVQKGPYVLELNGVMNSGDKPQPDNSTDYQKLAKTLADKLQ